MNTTPSEHDIHAYVDGRLSGPARQAVERYLAEHPEQAAEVVAWQRDAQQLRAAFSLADPLPDNPALDPARLRRARQQRRGRWLAIAATLVLGLSLGGLGGWQLHDWDWNRQNPPMGDALAAYRLATRDPDLRMDIVSDQPAALQHWLDSHLQRSLRLPDLSEGGFHPVGGRLFIADRAVAAMVLYEDARHHAISFYARPPSPLRHLLPSGMRAEDGLLAQYGSDRQHNIAMISHDDTTDRRIAATALLSAL